jgi:hypothetical protein
MSEDLGVRKASRGVLIHYTLGSNRLLLVLFMRLRVTFILLLFLLIRTEALLIHW